MKKLFYLFVAASMVLTSCGNDDDGSGKSSKKGTMEIDGESINLRAGTIENYGESAQGGSYNFDVFLFSSEITIQDGELMPKDNNVSAIYFEMWSENSSGLKSGTYTLDEFGDNAGTFSFSELVLDYNINTEDGTYYEIISGEIEVDKNGNTYDIYFEGETAGGKNVQVDYNGTLRSF